ncbi:MAG TPA: 2-amino-4-hydroxy-6-hydroxymethyldihydropteridine diphosphokinase [Acidimicrobiia bacterium]|nr:2-amino-4-hydroxy-6-hydroxymethyldihydropteridine diphosphokinase [Acidimicrobiia bacterium]
MGLGSNLGDRLAALTGAVEGFRRLGEAVAVSGVWETAPIGGPPQDDYLNAVAVVRTVLGPVPLMQRLLTIEAEAGRERGERSAPRTLDLDLLLYGDAEIDAPGLTVPHPRMHTRRFVLEPLAEAWPGAVIPGHGTVEELLETVQDQRASSRGLLP